MSDETLASLAEALVVRPGDTLIVRLSADMTVEQFTRFRESIEPTLNEKLPGVKVLIIGGVEQLAVYRPGVAGP
ncbi:hypothetical protein ABGB18_42745 [Nonomuraea sp. B12E4]|uniref:hypothetical protein n=1 Tax=Nonomuraea sp. B12E4 TaxID=3153564 RepID=UPI00325CD067